MSSNLVAHLGVDAVRAKSAKLSPSKPSSAPKTSVEACLDQDDLAVGGDGESTEPTNDKRDPSTGTTGLFCFRTCMVSTSNPMIHATFPGPRDSLIEISCIRSISAASEP